MKIKDTLQRDPSTHPLVNQGQARIADRTTEREIKELQGELATFVCEGEYAEGIQRILQSFLTNLNHTSQKAAWVSGFFGSGKSHLLKMLCHLWVDTSFEDGSTARSLVPHVPADIIALLRELDTAGKRAGSLLAAAGSLLSGSTDNVRQTVLSVLLRGAGLPEQYAQAKFCLWLHDEGYLNQVRKTVEAAGKVWEVELNNLYVSGLLARAVLSCDPNFGTNEAEARKTIRAQFDQPKTDISTSEFLNMAKRVMQLRGNDGRLPCTILVLDEVQQYIGDSVDRSALVTEVTEALSKQLDNHLIVVGAGQSALSDMRLLHKMLDRFTIRVTLSDTDVEVVTRKVLLQKKASTVADVRKVLEDHAGEVSRQLQGTKIGETGDDRGTIVEDYPLLPVRRRFWEHCFRTVDLAGTSSQLRSQLRIIHDAVAKVADEPLGAVVPADELYDALAPEMVNTGVLLREINERIISVKDGTPDGELAYRICSLVFLIGQLPRQTGADIGVRAIKEHLADLLVEDLRADNGKLRDDVETTLERLAKKGVLMQLGEEYRLQTREGEALDKAFRNLQAKLANDDVTVQAERDRLLYAEAGRIIGAVKLLHGQAKDPRQLIIHRDQTPPALPSDGIPVWIRDGWSAPEKEMVEAARKAGSDDPIIYVFVPRQAAEDLKAAIVETEAAEDTLNQRGHPTTAEGQLARQSLEGRKAMAQRRRDDLVKQVVGNAKVFQGGGSEVLQLELADKIREAAEASLARLYPRFGDADASSSAWRSAIKRARDGADQPFQPIGHTGSTEDHPVSREVIRTIGSGATGTAVRKELRAAPFGWPQDAIDAALLALHRSQHLTATLNGVAVPLGQLDQNKIAKAEFRTEQTTLTMKDRLLLRKVFGQLGVSCKTGEESSRAPEFLEKLLQLARAAGGEPPLPKPPSVTPIEDLKGMAGNQQLAAIKDRAAQIEKWISDWKETSALAESRLPLWRSVERLAHFAADLPEAADASREVEAVRTGRMLLDPGDPANAIRASLAGTLRSALNAANEAWASAHEAGARQLDESETWKKLEPAVRQEILDQVRFKAPPEEDLSSDDALIECLDRQPLSARRAEAAAVPNRVQQALVEAARKLEPEIQTVHIDRSTIRSEDELNEWLEGQAANIRKALKKGPVLLS